MQSRGDDVQGFWKRAAPEFRFWLLLLVPPILFGGAKWLTVRPTYAPGADPPYDYGTEWALVLSVLWAGIGLAVSGSASIPLALLRYTHSAFRKVAWVVLVLLCVTSAVAAARSCTRKSEARLFHEYVADPTPAGVQVQAVYGWEQLDGGRWGFVLETSPEGFANLTARCGLEYTQDLDGYEETLGFRSCRRLCCDSSSWPPDMTEVWLGGVAATGTNYIAWTDGSKTKVFLVANRGDAINE